MFVASSKSVEDILKQHTLQEPNYLSGNKQFPIRNKVSTCKGKVIPLQAQCGPEGG